MKRLFARYLLFVVSFMSAAHCLTHEDDYRFYVKLDSGISVAQLPNILAPVSAWNESLQGYNSPLGHTAIAGLSVGCEFFEVLDLEVSISNRSVFEYRAFQIPMTGAGSYTREFDLSVTPILFSANILGRGIPHLHWDFNESKIYPMIGCSVGMSNLLITNFRTTGLPATGDSYPYNSFSSENQYTLVKNFTYALRLGFEYSHTDRWAIGTGYRWLHAGNFAGPQYLRVADGAAVDIAPDQWQMRFQANEWFIEFKIFI